MLKSHSLSHRGSVRDTNEDSLVEDLAHGVWIIADGVGGNGNGDVASQLATQTVERKLRQGDSMIDAILGANDAITHAVAENIGLSNMATTLVACQFNAGHFELAWVGDSRAYLLNANGIVQLSSDHNLANDLHLRGDLAAEDVASHPGQHELTQALGQMTLERIPKNIGELQDGDCLLLCTDGLSGVLDEPAIYDLVMGTQNLREASDSLLGHVLERGAPDNVTFSLIRFNEDETAIKASDFESPSYRLPFDRKPYDQHCKNRPWLLVIILVSIVAVLVLI